MAVSLDLNTFSVPKLQTGEGQHDAFEHLNEVLAVGHIEDVVRDLLSKPGLFVYILSVFPDAASMRAKILDAFPTDPQILQQSFIPPLLSTTSSFFFSLPSDVFHGDESRTIGRYERYNADVWPAMAILSSIAFETVTPRNSMNARFKERKTSVSAHDVTALRKLNIQPPTDSSTAMKALGDVVAVVLQMLKFYLTLLSDPRFMDQCKDVFFGAGGERDEEDSGDVLPLAYTQTPHLEATLAASDIDRFGEWTILMANSATKDLLQLRRRDAKMTECVLKRIRQLSRGNFSGNNCRAFHGPSHGIPIYQAEVLSNLRIIYQIDCALDDDGQVRDLFLFVKIYGIYSHKQLDHVWPWLSQLLNGRGKVYRQRCTLRESAELGGGVYRPAIFSPRHEEFAVDQSPVFVHDDETNEAYLNGPYYRAVRNLYITRIPGLIAEQEVELPFQLTTKEWQVVRCPTSCYVIGRSGTGKTTAMVFKMLGIQRAWEQVSGVRKPRQLFVTRFPVLAAKVNEFFTSLVESLALAGRTRDELRELRSQVRNAEHQEPPMMNPMNALNYRPGTPQKFSELTDHDFPLFITFDQLARMVAADIQVDDSKECACPKFILDKVISDESSFVTYSAFRTHYWPRICDTFRSTLARSFGPWLVFSEFMGVIKGSETAFHSPNGILDRHTYVDLSTRAYPVFAGDRHSLYTAFELYSRLLCKKYSYDMGDRTYAILKALSCNPLKGQPVDYLYVDEVQDNLIIDTILLRILCRNADGLFWAGDTAQTISAGSSFRFADLKAFIHRTEAAGTMAIQKSRTKPEVFELPVNHRSHSGIVNCAQLVVKLVTDFWPDSIDTLQPECAMFGGPKPVFFAGWPDETFPFEHFFSGLRASRELGAEQCILVRDNAVREQIRKQFGDIAVILTLEASKGLEFDDVFLYNFFEDSVATFLQWRMVLMAHSERDIPLPRGMGGSPHSVLCTELKNLYVGITRARKKLYLLDHSRNSEPMRELWSKKGLIDVAPPGTNICQYADKSTPQQWAAAGHKLFNACQFQEAVHCFERANLPKQLRIAQAYGLYEVANSTVQTSERQRAFLDAAVAFVQCAGEALDTKKKGFYKEAAECYASADNATMAAEFYITAGDFAGAAEQYRKAGCFDEIVQILDRHPTEIAGSYRNKLLYICVAVHRPPIPLFSSTENELAYLESQGLNEARIDLLESVGRFLEAAEVHLGLGQWCVAIECLLKDQQNPDALQRAVDLALESLWQECSFDQPVQAILQNKRSDSYKVLNCVQAIPLERLEVSRRGQIRFFRAVQQTPFAEEVYQLGEEFCSRGEEAMALMAFNVFSSQLAAVHSADAGEFDNFLRRFERYVRLLISIVSDEIPFRATDPEVMKVFGIVPSSHHNYSVIAGTFLHRPFEQNRYLPTEINDLLKAQLQAHLRKKFEDENDASRISQAFSTQCPYSIMHDRHCGRQQCNQQHERGLYSNAASYNMIINVHLQQIRMSDLMFSAVGSRGDRLSSMTAALNCLYAAIYCPIFVQGSIADLDWNFIRNAAECIRVVRKWIEKTIEYLKPTGQPPNYTNYLMSVIRVTSLHTAFGGVCPLQEYVLRQGCRVSYGGQPFKVIGDNVSADIVACLTGSNAIRGLQALRFLLQNGVRMDLLVVSNFAEEVCRTFVSSLHPSGNSSPLHGLLVPRGWIMNPNKPLVHRDTIQGFLRCLLRLVNILRSGRAHSASLVCKLSA
ncbi:hypothetical protein PISMIDRAFT_110119 [Pisolithus microcarpus 441]|uniref:UvrD-like helicase ATP-binding domain-containing protein n=1 Tax=Pisolithus microcarpus 441 TaxID=765257 RepID=A0A0C9ZDS2_9AGAM|nr:hypothetical protein PISMIDRAFT_110119 [Pisolithus microcarpus 441]